MLVTNVLSQVLTMVVFVNELPHGYFDIAVLQKEGRNER